MSFKSATTAATDIHSSTSSSSETTTWRTSSSTHLTTTMSHPHPSGYPYWDSIRSASGQISLSNLYFLHRLNAGDISSACMIISWEIGFLRGLQNEVLTNPLGIGSL
ncbi:hypothetical protein LguiA_007853 [Lonicera macranthoides]